ncbi:hypothetical protein MC378_12120 [Polaribacter sp. MSW13]|uniref:DUF2974 domain-containing protein n=1 Tax=Polaribacter marinus TaxID=2916838 RepID=A0A9X1VNQ5_9FLAO|nr:hypothetical protein [Polaribacter marinus]MCI2229914.1 hypothetical protein [Polaribacter marinus]
MRNILILFIFSVFVSGCCSSKIELTGCKHSSGWCNEIRDISSESWKYAQLSKNVYKDDYKFDVSAFFESLEVFSNDKIDYYSELFKDKSNGDLVLVFRGTDSFEDFRTGNNPFKQRQNDYALKIFDEIRNKYGSENYIVAGHSLGGGISIHVSLNRENVVAFSFNGSPVFRNKKNFKNKRYSIVENGEILKIVRLLGKEANQLYTSIGCSKGNLISQHDMKSLALCLTQIGAIKNHQARESLKTNNIDFKYKK